MTVDDPSNSITAQKKRRFQRMTLRRLTDFEELTDAQIQQNSYSTTFHIYEKARRDPEWLAVSQESIYRRILEGLVYFYPTLRTLNIENFHTQTLHVLKFNVRVDQKKSLRKLVYVHALIDSD